MYMYICMHIKKKYEHTQAYKLIYTYKKYKKKQN